MNCILFGRGGHMLVRCLYTYGTYGGKDTSLLARAADAEKKCPVTQRLPRPDFGCRHCDSEAPQGLPA